ncbi:hypothetical protein [Corynebacterium variabile]|uniref:hypothetical protein n=1 Tax=Corynebacterium variabile TaxID=1727 RepID=UPI003BAF7CC6
MSTYQRYQVPGDQPLGTRSRRFYVQSQALQCRAHALIVAAAATEGSPTAIARDSGLHRNSVSKIAARYRIPDMQDLTNEERVIVYAMIDHLQERGWHLQFAYKWEEDLGILPLPEMRDQKQEDIREAKSKADEWDAKMWSILDCVSAHREQRSIELAALALVKAGPAPTPDKSKISNKDLNDAVQAFLQAS